MTMNPSGGLASLVSALQSGMSGSDAFGIVQYLESEQQRRMAQRADRLSGLASLLTQAAGGGMTYDAAQAMADAQPGPAGPAVEQMLAALYPSAQQPITPMSESAPIDTQGGRGGGMINPQMLADQQAAAQYSPVYTGNPQAQADAQMQQMQVQQAQAQANAVAMQPAMDAEWATFAQSMANAKMKGVAPDVAYATFVQANPEFASILSTTDGQARVKGILESTFGHAGVQYAGGAVATG